MNEFSVPGAFPSTPEENDASNRTPKRRFVGRRTAERQVERGQDAESKAAVEGSSTVIQKGTNALTALSLPVL